MDLIERAARRLEQAGKDSSTTLRDAATPLRRAAPRAPRGADIDLARLRAAGMIAPGSRPSLISEEFRQVKRPLLDNAFRADGGGVPRGRLILVTSALPGEGKSFCSANLALSIACELDHSVLLIDGDVARPKLLDLFGLEWELGLLDLVADDQLAPPDVMIQTNLERLSIIPAGRARANATELLSSAAMRRLLDELASEDPDRVIVIDSPPLLSTTEARVLAPLVGQVVMVVEAGRTTREASLHALEYLADCDVVNLLMNKSRPLHPGDLYSSFGAYAT